MVARFDREHLLAAWAIASVIALAAFSASEFTPLLDFAQTGRTLHRFANPRHDPAAYHPNAFHPFFDEREMEQRDSGLQVTITLETLASARDAGNQRNCSTDWNVYGSNPWGAHRKIGDLEPETIEHVTERVHNEYSVAK